MSDRSDFDAILSECKHRTAAEVLSPQVADALDKHLETVHHDKSAELPSRLDVMLKTMQALFGSGGTKTVGKAIAKRLYSRLGLEFATDPRKTLLEHVQYAKVEYLKSQIQSDTDSER